MEHENTAKEEKEYMINYHGCGPLEAGVLIGEKIGPQKLFGKEMVDSYTNSK